jgi:Fur family zinc uptake transcriptional regulator
MSKTGTKDIIRKAQNYCDVGGHRFTDPRKYVLKIIAAADKPITAYDVLAKLGEKIVNPKPPTAYRAIEFLSDHHFIHRIESLNAYVLCQSDHHHEGSQFMICDDCGTVTEAHLCHLPSTLEAKTRAEGFHLSRWNVELHGTCKACAH